MDQFQAFSYVKFASVISLFMMSQLTCLNCFQEKCVEFLLENGFGVVDAVDIQHLTPLHYAVYRGHKPCVALLKYDAHNIIRREDALGKNPIDIAKDSQESDISKTLLEKDAGSLPHAVQVC